MLILGSPVTKNQMIKALDKNKPLTLSEVQSRYNLKKYAEGTVVSGQFSGMVSGIAFRPKVVVISILYTGSSPNMTTIVLTDEQFIRWGATSYYGLSVSGTSLNGTVAPSSSNQLTMVYGSNQITNDGFSFSFSNDATGRTFTWKAYGA